LLQIFSAVLRQNYTSDVKVFSRLENGMDLLNRPSHDGALTSLAAGGREGSWMFFVLNGRVCAKHFAIRGFDFDYANAFHTVELG